jgi:hypothetical protein
MMKNKSTIARLLAEEDIHIVNKKMDTAYFNIKKRELGLPIWKDEISKVEEELMVCHEIGHALWTSMDMIEKSTDRGLNASFVNILEDARIEKLVKRKYPGSVNLFKKGYAALAARDFFGIAETGVNSCNLIDRINLFFKEQDGVEFSDEEKVFVDRAAKLETEDEVLDLAEELYKYMEENPETDKHDDGESDGKTVGNGESAPSGTGDNGEKSSEESGDTSNDLRSDDDPTVGDSGNNVGEEDDGDDDGTAAGGSAGDSDDAGDDTESSADTSKGSEVGGNATSSSPAGIPEAKTDKALSDALKSLVDGNANEKVYGRIPKVDSSEFIVDYKTVIDELGANYSSEEKWVGTSLGEVKEFKNDSKKTVNYMVKEFEMKKSADQYARAATSKTGTLDMGALHTYKFNDDLFKKVTTLPGATNHGMVMVVDWSGSMCDNLKGTIEQLLQLVMFCRRTKIPFEVFAFTSCYNGNAYSSCGYIDVNYGETPISKDMRFLNFFSSKMSAAEEEKMMHYLWMIGKRYNRTYEDWYTTGYPVNPPSKYSLGGTPLNDAIIVLMDFLPKYKKASGVQKINTIFLTDGASNSLPGVKDNNAYGDFYQGFRRENLLIDPVTNKRYEFGDYNNDVTDTLLKALKGRVPGMNVVGFFLAGSGRNGNIKRNTWSYILMGGTTKVDAAMVEMRKNKVVVLESKGYDQYYILPGGAALAVENDGLDDKLVGASKGKLKTAFAKSNKGRIQSRVLLNKFVALVA